MNIVRIIFITVIMSSYGLPVPVVAQSAAEFRLPGATAGKPYSTNLAAVLRETYRLKVETDSRMSILRWAFTAGEMPPGLGIRANGTIVGIPRQPRVEPYCFEVRVLDLTSPASQALRVDFSLVVTARTIRLSQISALRLSPVEATDSAADRLEINMEPSRPIEVTTPDSSQRVSKELPNSRSLTYRQPVVTNSAFSLVRNGSTSLTSEQGVEAVSNGSRETTADSSQNELLIKPVLRTVGTSAANPYPAPLPTAKLQHVQDVSKEAMTGDRIRGPATIELKNLNELRYDIDVGKDVTFPPAPDLKLPFIPPIPSQPKPADTPPVTDKGAVASDPISVNFNASVDLLNTIEHEKGTDVNGEIVKAIRGVNLARSSLESLVTASDSILGTGGGPIAIITEVTRLTATDGEIDSGLSKTWPDAKIEDLLGRLEILKNRLLTLPTTSLGANWPNWYTTNKSTYDAIVARVTELQAQLNGLKSNSAQGTAFSDAQKKLRAWKPILIGVRDGGTERFNRTVKVGCGFAFDTGKETKVKIIKTDRWAEPGTAPTIEEVVTVVCSSRLSVSAGFGFSNVDEREFVFVPSTKTVTGANGQTSEVVISRFGFKNKSSFRTLPVLLLNTRIWEPSDTFALHISTGAAVDVKTGQGGTDLEYIVGPSISLWRSLFVTPGLHIGRVPKLVGGFQLDQEVPTGISEPPIEKAWKKGFVTTFTYKLR